MLPVSDLEMAVAKENVTTGLSRAECLCPVCLEIFMEPVTLPCLHTFCKPCFLETVDKANLCCPLCRKRVSTWARLNSRNKTLVNDELWRRVQAAFPMQCQRRLSGQEEDEDNILVSRPKVSLPGEVRREYEDQISKLAEEKRALEEAERKASEEYIQRLLAEEEERLADERRKAEEKQLENDEKLAKLLSQELNPGPTSELLSNTRTTDITAAKKKTNTNAGDIEKFLSPIPQRNRLLSETSPTSSLVSNKENILQSETNYWSPKDLSERPMPLLDFYGHAGGNSPATRLEVSQAQELPLGTPAKRKSCVMEGSGEVFGKRTCPFSASSLHPQGGEVGLAEEAPLLQELAQREKALFSRKQQEEEDRQLALQLQKQLNREEALRAVDRRKGSDDQYQLRQKPSCSSEQDSNGSVKSGSTSACIEHRSSTGRRRRSDPSSVTVQGRDRSCTSVAATPSGTLKRGVKQATLTDMFTRMDS
ncbi:hypothetical protein UPYG_G00197360 [Umbra pygmaea]|uniref:RING-type E3 ubiquitin transferase n=1 Tax=Umbra pygmaea TaxID=75934 RepID=A0ABD0WMJ2_UMBPY